MTDKKIKLDSTDWEILAVLKRNARATFKTIGDTVKMTRPAVRERIQRMEEAGVISGYHAEIDIDALGKTMHVMVSFKFNSDMKYKEKPNDVLIQFLDQAQEVIQYWETYGDLDFLIESAFYSKDELHKFLDDLRSYGFVRSHLIAASSGGGSFPLHPEK